MSELGPFGDVGVDVGDDFVAEVELQRPPHNYFDIGLVASLCDAFEALDADPRCRAIVLCAAGKNFCAGAQLGGRAEGGGSGGPLVESGRHLYDEAVRLFSTKTPIVAAVQGAAVGGGLGLALMPDFRFASPESRFTANFAQLGFHHGFGLSTTLPDLVGRQRAMELLYTGKRIGGEEAHALGLADRLVSRDELRTAARAFAREIASSAPLAVASIRETLRGDLPARIRASTDREKAEQERLQKTKDFREGVRAMAERRPPSFTGE